MTKLKDRIIVAVKQTATDFPKREIQRIIVEHFTESPLISMGIVFSAKRTELEYDNGTNRLSLPMSWFFDFQKHFVTNAGFIMILQAEGEREVSYLLYIPEQRNN